MRIKSALQEAFRIMPKIKSRGYCPVSLTLEEGGVLENRMERLDELYEKGIRVINMTWNHENCLGYPHNAPHSGHRGLKPFGFEVLERMDELGIVADVSHLSDEGFQDIIRYGRRPVIATHSDARDLRAVSRNLSDAMIRQIADCGGIIRVNFYSDFLSGRSGQPYLRYNPALPPYHQCRRRGGTWYRRRL